MSLYLDNYIKSDFEKICFICIVLRIHFFLLNYKKKLWIFLSVEIKDKY